MSAHRSPAPARQHLEWLRFAEPSGPFLSLPVLLRVFPQGLEKLERERAEDLFERLAEWREATAGAQPDLAVHRQWCLYVLRELLGWPAEGITESGEGVTLPAAMAPLGRERLTPDLLLANPPAHVLGAGNRVLVQIHPPAQPLDRAVADRPWRATPVDRLVELLRSTGVRLGLVTNGAEWKLVQLPPGELPGIASWDVDLWQDERGTLDAFVTLLQAKRFFNAAPADALEAMLDESAEHQHDVTVQLGDQVRKAVEVLVQALDRADRAADGELLRHVPPDQAYDGALTVMMRLVFLFSAEERELIGAGLPMYEQHYSVSRLREQLQDAADRLGEEVLETRHDAWARLLATFRAVHAGVAHEDLSLPAYGGSLFDPDRYPFLEGRAAGTSWRDGAARPLPVSNRTVLHLLSALQILKVKTPGAGGELRRLSFRALDIENIGHVYEGLLDHTAVRAESPDAPVLGLGGGKEPEIPLPRLEAERARGQEKLVEFLREETGRSARALERAIETPVVRDEGRALQACGMDRGLYERVRPWLGIVRDDTLDQPVVVREGSLYVTAGAERRTSGTHYTPRTLTEPIVRHALEPVVYEGPAEGRPESEWRLRGPRELLALKVCDFAMGSGAFLVQACRYLAERLVEAWEAVEAASPLGVRITPEGERSVGDPRERPIPIEPEERRIVAMRLIADRCLYGVDKNPMAVEMAKLSLWLVTLQKDRPFNFLDHALRCGDSLLGVTRAEQLEYFDLSPAVGDQIPMVSELLRPALAAAAATRRELESFTVIDVTDAERKAALLAEAEGKLAELRVAADALVGCAMAGHLKGADAGALLRATRDRVAAAMDPRLGAEERRARLGALAAEAQRMLDTGKRGRQATRRPFHWALEFPEVFEQGGFDAMVANPPFVGGKKICLVEGDEYNRFLKLAFQPSKGAADICAYFFRLSYSLLCISGTAGLLATNSISQTDTREVGLDVLVGAGATIYRAITLVVWPGTANVHASIVQFTRSRWRGEVNLDGAAVVRITSQLVESSKRDTRPAKLRSVFPEASGGTGLLGIGFVVERAMFEAWTHTDRKYDDIMFPYINGHELNNSINSQPTRYVINFGNRTEAEAAEYPLAFDRVRLLVKPKRDALVRQIHEKSYWKHWDKRETLYAAVGKLERVIVCSFVSKHLPFEIMSTKWVFSKELAVIPTADWGHFALLQSTIHATWARHQSGTLKSDLAYSISDALRTFPPVTPSPRMRHSGESYVALRNSIRQEHRQGLTSLYNSFHDRDLRVAGISRLRELHVDMDRAVADAYGWTDVDLGHGFHDTKQGIRFTLSPAARREVLARLLALNHERYREEVEQGLHRKRESQPRRTRKPAPQSTGNLFA
jgi:hypothetical protein